ncbi:MAG TPA: ATP-binding cassette domain-containing protein [Myxococcota bacterium]|nr:ATP-binding cassette domain-containing protein [Myxococcota bacterium]
MIVLEAVRLGLPGFVLGPLDLRVPVGEHAVVVGPSGAGKTLLLELVLGLRSPDAGRVLLDGALPASFDRRQRRIGWVPQDVGLFPHLRVRDNIAFGLPRRADVGARVEALAEALGLGQRLERYPEALSGGERQRVAMGRALAAEPALLLLDEPFAALDRPLRRRIWELLRQEHARRPLTTLHVTHDLADAVTLADRTITLMAGALQSGGLPGRARPFP